VKGHFSTANKKTCMTLTDEVLFANGNFSTEKKYPRKQEDLHHYPYGRSFIRERQLQLYKEALA
jgi:hypothetical protein